MNQKQPLTIGNKLIAAGLTLFGLSIPIQIAMGVTSYPVIPPGLFVTLAAAGLIIFGRWRWAVAVGIVLSCVLLIGTIASGWVPKVIDPSSIGYPAIVSQMLGLAVALIGSIMGGIELSKMSKK
jgi:hypothetical protein